MRAMNCSICGEYEPYTMLDGNHVCRECSPLGSAHGSFADAVADVVYHLSVHEAEFEKAHGPVGSFIKTGLTQARRLKAARHAKAMLNAGIDLNQCLREGKAMLDWLESGKWGKVVNAHP